MSTPQTIERVAPRSRTRPATLLTALGVLVAIAVSIAILALTGANHITVATPVTASQATTSPTPQIRYLGPRQVGAALAAGAAQTHGATTNAGGVQASAWQGGCLKLSSFCLH